MYKLKKVLYKAFTIIRAIIYKQSVPHPLLHHRYRAVHLASQINCFMFGYFSRSLSFIESLADIFQSLLLTIVKGNQIQGQFEYFLCHKRVTPKLSKTKTEPYKTKKMINKMQHLTNGNIKFLHLNKGNSNILTKITLIQDLVNQENPSLISLNESNVELNQANQTNPLKEYKFEHKILKINQTIGTKARTSLGIN